MDFAFSHLSYHIVSRIHQAATVTKDIKSVEGLGKPKPKFSSNMYKMKALVGLDSPEHSFRPVTSLSTCLSIQEIGRSSKLKSHEMPGQSRTYKR